MTRARIGREPTITGSVTLGDLDTSAPVVFPVAYPTAVYTVQLGAVQTLLGLPAVVTPSVTGQVSTGFTLTLDQAPGLGTSIAVPYFVTPS